MININIKYKKKFFKINIKKNEINLIKILLKINYIRYVKKINQNLFLIFPVIKKSSKPFFLQNWYRPSNLFSIRKKELKKTVIKTKQIIILSTSNGLQLVSKQNQCVGGVLVAKLIFN